MARCSYRYNDKAQCMYDDSRLAKGGMCQAHRIMLISKARRIKARERNKARA